MERKCFDRPWEGLLHDSSCFYVVLLYKRIPIAYVIGRIIPPEGEILRLGVLKEWRRKGFGRMVMENTLGFLLESGAKRVFLEVSEKNHPALNLYRSMGFKEIMYRPSLYSDGSRGIIMYRDLP